MKTTFEKFILATVILGVILLAFFINSTKDVELNPIPSETDSVVSQEVATVSDEVVEPEVPSTEDVAIKTILEYEVNTETTVSDKPSNSLVGKEAPGFYLTTIEEKDFFLSESLTKPLFINFFNTNCVPCLLELPDLQSFYSKNKEVINVAIIDYCEFGFVKDTKEIINKVLGPLNLDLTILLDNYGIVTSAYGVNTLPASFLIDSNGILLWEKRSRVSKDDLNQLEGKYDKIFK